jgi:uncharacterized membrane protein YoaK (UPF0700 family)
VRILFNNAGTIGTPASRDDVASSRAAQLEDWLPPMLSVVAGMVDLTGFYTLGNVFTAHVTGNLVVVTAALVSGEPLRWAQALAIPVFMLAIAGIGLLTRSSGARLANPLRLLLFVHFLLLAIVLLVCVWAKPSTQPHGLIAGVAAMIAVGAMACQFALLRLAMPHAISTAVMTGNLTNFVLSSMSLFAKGSSETVEEQRLWLRSALLLCGFLCGCGIAAVSVRMMADWAWVPPVMLAAVLTVLVTSDQDPAAHRTGRVSNSSCGHGFSDHDVLGDNSGKIGHREVVG